ncbi:MAG: hypothetical protein LBT84_08085, partial [Spirochaetia bacterium]|nr:hypothetical protein [Spirochaetia bacterium]
MKKITLFIISAVLFSMTSDSIAWEKYDRVIATVNYSAIIESDIELKFGFMQSARPVAAAKINYEKSRILDQFIEDELVSQTAEESAIIVNDKKVLNRIENLLKSYISRNLKQGEDPDKIEADYTQRILAKVEAERNSGKEPKIDERLQGFFD